MFLQVGLILTTLLFAHFVLFTSIFRTSQPNAFRSYLPNPAANTSVPRLDIGWSLLSFENVLPDHPLWIFLAARDKLFHLVINDPVDESKYLLNCSNRRVIASKALFKKGNPDLGMATLVKGTLYLEEAVLDEESGSKRDVRSDNLLNDLALSSITQKALTDEILIIAPESAKPDVIKIQDRSKKVFQKIIDEMKKRGLTPPENPFKSE